MERMKVAQAQIRESLAASKLDDQEFLAARDLNLTEWPYGKANEKKKADGDAEEEKEADGEAEEGGETEGETPGETAGETPGEEEGEADGMPQEKGEADGAEEEKKWCLRSSHAVYLVIGKQWGLKFLKHLLWSFSLSAIIRFVYISLNLLKALYFFHSIRVHLSIIILKKKTDYGKGPQAYWQVDCLQAHDDEEDGWWQVRTCKRDE